jgi:hypothetical protein
MGLGGRKFAAECLFEVAYNTTGQLWMTVEAHFHRWCCCCCRRPFHPPTAHHVSAAGVARMLALVVPIIHYHP